MKNVLADRLRALRGSMSQTDFALKLGVKQTSYSSWERGIKDPLAQTLAQIANTLGVSADWLLGLSDVRDYTNSAAPTVAPPQTKKIIGRTSPRSEADLLAEIRALRARVDALESSPAFACC